MNRETKTIETTKGTKIVVNTYVTGREANVIKAELLKKAKINGETGEVDNSGISGDFIIEQERKLLEVIVVSINDSKEGIVDKLQDLPNGEYQEVVAAVNEIYTAGLAARK